MTGDDGNFDVVILGAGINGGGLFRDLCEQGVRCLILDKDDFGSGTSAAPSRLIHGGLKYLETGEFGLVAQSTLERNLLLRNAPHCVAPLPTLIPIFSWTKGVGAALRTLAGSTTAPRSRGAVLIKIGLWLYDLYGARHRIMPRHRMIGRARALRETPGLTPAIVAAGLYHDAWIRSPERLVHELIVDGIAANPRSQALNHTTLERRTRGTLTFRREDGTTLSVTPKIVVNAAGPWIDRTNAAMGIVSRLIGGAKGSHVLLDHPDLIRSLAGRMIYFEADDGRICLVYDYLGLALVGSTDIRADDPDDVRCEEDEIAYFIASLRALMPGLSFDASQIVYAYSGIRPLPASDAKAGLVSRDHSAPWAEPEGDRPFPVVAMVGGKWTTFRGFAAEVADAVLGKLGHARVRSTEALPIGGGAGFPSAGDRARWVADVAEDCGLDPARVEALLSRYGTTARAIAARCVVTDDARLPDSTDHALGEIDWIAREDRVRHLSDIVLRRTTLAIGGTLTEADLERIAEVAGQALGWSEERRREEVSQTRMMLADRHRFRLRAPDEPT